MKEKRQFKVKDFKNPSGRTVYRVSGYYKEPKNGKRQHRENFRTRDEADAMRDRLEAEYHGGALPLQLKPTALTDVQLLDAAAAYNRLGSGKSLLPVVEYYLTHCTGIAEECALLSARTKFIDEKKAMNKRPATIRNLNDRVGRFVKRHPLAKVSDIGRSDVQTFLDLPGKGAHGRDSDRRVLHSFFAWCKKKNFCTLNPVADIDTIHIDRDEISILPLDGARRMVAAAQSVRDGVCLPYVILGLFCGLRPTEMTRLTWDDLDATAGTVTIGAKIAKMRQRRIVEIPANALALLQLAAKNPFYGRVAGAVGQPIVQAKNWRKNFDAVKKAAGYSGRKEAEEKELPKEKQLPTFPMDVMRHTAISYHLGLHRNEGLTAEWAGNSPTIIQKHYRALVKQEDVAKFWAIGLPKPRGKKTQRKKTVTATNAKIVALPTEA